MKGAYILFIRLKKMTKINVGKLGNILFMPGIYAYIGSGMNNLEMRINRHLKRDKKKRWHIDYLLDVAEIIGILTMESEEKIECNIATFFAKKFKIIKGFGSSDCDCKGHLFILQQCFPE